MTEHCDEAKVLSNLKKMIDPLTASGPSFSSIICMLSSDAQ